MHTGPVPVAPRGLFDPPAPPPASSPPALRRYRAAVEGRRFAERALATALFLHFNRGPLSMGAALTRDCVRDAVVHLREARRLEGAAGVALRAPREGA